MTWSTVSPQKPSPHRSSYKQLFKKNKELYYIPSLSLSFFCPISQFSHSGVHYYYERYYYTLMTITFYSMCVYTFLRIANIPPAVRGSISTPVQQREQTRPFNPSPAIPRPTEEKFRPALLGTPGRPISQPIPPRQFVQVPPPSGVRTSPQQVVVGGGQQRQPITSSLPSPLNKPALGRPIHTNPAPANFAPAAPPQNPASVTLSQANKAKNVQPECNLFSDSICLDVRNYPTYVNFYFISFL